MRNRIGAFFKIKSVVVYYNKQLITNNLQLTMEILSVASCEL